MVPHGAPRSGGRGCSSEAARPHLRLLDVGTSNWSYETAGVVDAVPEAVMGGGYTANRIEWYLNRIESAGARHLRVEESTSNGTRTRTIQYMDRTSWTTTM